MVRLMVCRNGGVRIACDKPVSSRRTVSRCGRKKPLYCYITRIRGFSGCCFELIAGLKIELGLERVDLVGGDGCDDVNEGVDDGSMLGQIEGRELLDMANDGLGHVPGLEQGSVLQR